MPFVHSGLPSSRCATKCSKARSSNQHISVTIPSSFHIIDWKFKECNWSLVLAVSAWLAYTDQNWASVLAVLAWLAYTYQNWASALAVSAWLAYTDQHSVSFFELHYFRHVPRTVLRTDIDITQHQLPDTVSKQTLIQHSLWFHFWHLPLAFRAFRIFAPFVSRPFFLDNIIFSSTVRVVRFDVRNLLVNRFTFTYGTTYKKYVQIMARTVPSDECDIWACNGVCSQSDEARTGMWRRQMCRAAHAHLYGLYWTSTNFEIAKVKNRTVSYLFMLSLGGF